MSRTPFAGLRAFVDVVRYGSLSAAAGHQHLTVSALSHQMKALEGRLGGALLQRGSRGVTPTPAGQRLFAAIEPAFAVIDAASQALGARRAHVLTLSVLPSMASGWLIPRLGRFVEAHPQLEINLRSDTALVDFDRQPDIDAALRFGAGSWPGLNATLLFGDALAPVASPELLAARRWRAGQAIDSLPLLGDPGKRWVDWFRLEGRDRSVRCVATFADSESLHRAAVEGVGVALARLSLTQSLVAAGRLRVLSRRRLPSPYAHYLVVPARSADHPGVQALRAWLLAEAASHTFSAKAARQAAPPATSARGAPARRPR
ncbi:MAG: LysR substrate-binding domain-containing protein [Silanimonas sp.]